jgi:hypothetical protein
MGKIGDLIVRLQLKYQDYQKGLKKAAEETTGFVQSLGKIKAAGLAVWAAIGTAVMKVASDMVKATGIMEDKWELFTVKAKAGWDTFIKTLINGDWSDFVRQFKEATAAAAYLTEALQGDTEVQNSIALQKAAMANELAALEILMKDVTKSDEERARAAEEYKKKVLPLYDQEIARLDKLRKAYAVTLGAGIYSKSTMETPEMLAAVEKFLIEYGKETQYKILNNRSLSEALAIALKPYNAAPKTNAEISEQRARKAMIERLSYLSQDMFPNLDPNFLFNIATNYETKFNGEQIQEIVEVIKQYNNAIAAFKEENKKIINLEASLSEKAQKTAEKAAEPLVTINELINGVEEIDLTDIDIEPIDWDDILGDYDASLDEFLDKWKQTQAEVAQLNAMLEDAIVASMSNGTQALTDMLVGLEGADASQLMAALLQPFADTMISLGEMLIAEGLAVAAFKESLSSLDPAVALAAGATLLALGSALSSGIKKLGQTAGSGATTTSTSAGSSTSGIENIQTEMTIYVKGELKGSDIVLSGQRTLNKWRR